MCTQAQSQLAVSYTPPAARRPAHVNAFVPSANAPTSPTAPLLVVPPADAAVPSTGASLPPIANGSADVALSRSSGGRPKSPPPKAATLGARVATQQQQQQQQQQQINAPATRSTLPSSVAASVVPTGTMSMVTSYNDIAGRSSPYKQTGGAVVTSTAHVVDTAAATAPIGGVSLIDPSVNAMPVITPSNAAKLRVANMQRRSVSASPVRAAYCVG
jgi:hypothetical protein